MNKNTALLIAAITLMVGGIGGYAMRGERSERYSGKESGMTHMMADGTSMAGSDTPSSMASTMSDMNANLIGKTGDAFDQEFLSEMIVHHQGAVQMAQLALTNAKHTEIKTLAAGIIAAQNKEISEMQSWQKSWYGNTTANN